MLFEDHFDGPALDQQVWVPHYLPGWSSRAATAACYELRDSCLRLSIPPAQGLWLPGEHEPPLRVSGIQSGNFSGPVGLHPFRDPQVSEDFETVPVPIDVAEFHTYAVDWSAARVGFFHA